MVDANEIQIASLPMLPLAQRADLPDCSAIYFAIADNGEVLYIGRAASLAQRWGSHHRRYQLEQVGNVRIAWLEADAAALAALEFGLVERFQPSLNGTLIDNGPDGRVSCHIRIPLKLYKWLDSRPERRLDSVPSVIVQLVAKAMKAGA